MSSVEQPHLVSLVLQSKKALQHGEQLCSRAHFISQQSSQVSIDVLALDANVRWLTDAVVEQLKLALTVAKSLEEKQAYLNRQVQAWDTLRNTQTDALDNILDSLGAQTVPPSFHQTSADSSLFGSQPATPPATPFQEPQDINEEHFSLSPPQQNGFTYSNTSNGHVTYGSASTLSPDQSPTTTLRGIPILSRKGKGKAHLEIQIDTAKEKRQKTERKHWRTLRDFVDDKAIEMILDSIDQQRTSLDLLLGKSLLYPESLRKNVDLIYESLPIPRPTLYNNQSTYLRSTHSQGKSSRHAHQNSRHTKSCHQFIEEVLSQQDVLSASMATNLEGLASVYDQMAGALRDSEGEGFSPEDMPAIERDIQELPTVIGELEESTEVLEHHFQILLDARRKAERDLEVIQVATDSLDELGEIMSSMVSNQTVIETDMETSLASLHDQLHTISELHEKYVAYEKTFSKLVVELQRRIQYRDAMEMMIREMSERLQRLTEDEHQLRVQFNQEYGAFLPEDLCLSVGNPPTRWEVGPLDGELRELLPEIDDRIIEEAKAKIGNLIESTPQLPPKQPVLNSLS